LNTPLDFPVIGHDDADQRRALELDRADPLARFRDEFLIPPHLAGVAKTYLCGNSLGLQPRETRAAVLDELEDWAELAVEAHFAGKHPWMHYHRRVRDHLAELAGALPEEVVAMNSLTVNLHLLMAGFYRPVPGRSAILIEKDAFPSDRYAIQSQLRWHGLDPAKELIEIAADNDSGIISLASIERAIGEHGRRLALVLWPGVQYLSGQRFDLAAITQLGHRAGAVVGFDLAHAIGNVPVGLHDADADFAAWCSYKYLNAGPGAVAGAFVHQRHADWSGPRLHGWWGNNPASRFQMGPQFQATVGAEGWQLSNPSIFSLAPLAVALKQFHRAGFDRLRQKSVNLTGFLAELIERRLHQRVAIRTPAEAESRGCQLSLRWRGSREQGHALYEHLNQHGVVSDWREPDVIRLAPTPLYNGYQDCLRAVQVIEAFPA